MRTLAFAGLTLLLGGCAHWHSRQSQQTATVDEPGRIIQPEVERRKIKKPKIRSEDIELGAYAGIMSLEDFGSNPVYGARLAYHIAEDLFTEVDVGRTTAGLSSIERLAAVRVTQNRKYTYYSIDFGYNFLPGEIFLGKNYALNSTLYVIGGVGGTRFAGDDRFTINLGVGFRVLPTDWLAVHIDARDYRFATDLLGTNKAVNNLEGSLGISVFF
jgi:outer membrane beta-barrel protein